MEFKKYKIKLSNGADIPIDEDEVEIVVAGIQSGRVVRVRQGIFNPSFFVAMIIDEQRKMQWIDANRYRTVQEKDNSALLPLPDMFKGILPEIKKLKDNMALQKPSRDQQFLEK